MHDDSFVLFYNCTFVFHGEKITTYRFGTSMMLNLYTVYTYPIRGPINTHIHTQRQHCGFPSTSQLPHLPGGRFPLSLRCTFFVTHLHIQINQLCTYQQTLKFISLKLFNISRLRALIFST